MKTVYFDIDTQIDFVFPAGALYAPGANAVVAQVARLNRHAAAKGIPVVSTMDAHSENDPEFRHWPPHCVVGTVGQQKPAETMLDKRVVVPNTDAAVMIDGAQQIVVEKVTTNCFTNPNLQWVLDALNADRYIVYGFVTEVCVAIAAAGLLKTGKRVEVVADAMRALTDKGGRDAIERMQAAGAVLTTAEAALHNWVS